MADTRQFESTNPPASSDDEIVAALQRLAHAQALLFQAENDVTSPGEEAARLGERNREIEEAHTKLLWTQAETLTAPRGDRTPKTLEPHRKREQQALAKFGFASFDAYLDDRARRPTNNINLAKARREYRSAHEHWEEVLRSKSGTSSAPHAAVAAAPPASPNEPYATPAAGAMPPPITTVSAASFGSDGLAPSTRIGIAAAAVLLVLLAGFVVVKSRGPSTADAALSTAPTIPIVTTTLRPATITSIPPKGAATPTTAAVVAPTAPATTVAPAPTSTAANAPNRTAALCAASKIFSLEDLYGLAERAVANPKAFLQAYESMALTAPSNLTPHMQALGPLTREAVSQIQAGKIKTASELQQWLAAAPQEDLAQWITAQQIVIPAIAEICAAA